MVQTVIKTRIIYQLITRKTKLNSTTNFIAKLLALFIFVILGGCSGATEEIGPSGTITVYTSDNPLVAGAITVKIDDVVAGAVVTHLNTRPTTCNVNGALNKQVAVGNHTLVAIDEIGPWGTSDVFVAEGGCYIYCYTNHSYGCQ
jgi:hypothetical protein